jgi:hypothetical protein
LTIVSTPTTCGVVISIYEAEQEEEALETSGQRLDHGSTAQSALVISQKVMLAGGLWKETAGTRGSSRSMVVMSSIPHDYEGIFGLCTFSDIGRRKPKGREQSPVSSVKKICSVPRI